MNWRDHIHTDPKILLGKPVIKGTRLAVDFIIERMADGWTEKQLLENYPRLKQEHLNAIFAYIHECMQDGLLYELPKKSA